MKKLIIILVLAFPFYSYCQIINIPADYSTIQEGIDAAVDGDTVLVQPDSYYENLSIVAKNITLASLFLTTGDTSYIAATIIDGNASGRVIVMEDLTFDARLTGFTVQNGFDTLEDGGGIYLNSASPVISDMIVSNNIARKGGGLNCMNGTLQLSDVTFIQNQSIAEGGGIKAFKTNLFMNGCTFSGNTAALAGAMHYNINGMDGEVYVANVSSCRIENNIATNQVSGFSFMKSGGDAMVGVMIKDCDFLNNTCVSNGALTIMGDSVSFLVQNCSFIGNTANNFTAAAAFVQGCTGEVVNCLIDSNIGSTGGGNTNTGGFTLWGGVEMFLTNCTFVNNEAAYGAGITIGPESEAYFGNCIFWGNAFDHIALVDHDGSGGTAYIDYCDIQYGTDSIRVDPFSMLNWGDHNITSDPMFLGSGDDLFSLAAGSPCIDIGTPDTTGMGLPPYDLVSNIRVWDGLGGGTAIIDMGAYEYGAPVWVGIDDIASPKSTMGMDLKLFPNPAREWINLGIENTVAKRIKVDIYSLNGRKVKSLADINMQSGNANTLLYLGDLPPGIYFIRINDLREIKTRKVVVL